MLARVPRLVGGTTGVLICDVQERFRGLIHNMPSVIRSAGMLVRYEGGKLTLRPLPG